MSAWLGWEAQVLQKLGALAGPHAVGLLRAWQSCEGGSAAFNPLNTTQPEPGATDYNSVHVKNYPSQEVGLRATVATLTNGFYPGIVRDLRMGTYTPAAIVARNAAEFSKWGTSTVCLAKRAGLNLPPAGHAPQPTPSIQFGGQGVPVGTHAVQPTSVFVAWATLTDALALTIPTQARRARAARNAMTRAIR